MEGTLKIGRVASYKDALALHERYKERCTFMQTELRMLSVPLSSTSSTLAYLAAKRGHGRELLCAISEWLVSRGYKLQSYLQATLVAGHTVNVNLGHEKAGYEWYCEHSQGEGGDAVEHEAGTRHSTGSLHARKACEVGLEKDDAAARWLREHSGY